MSGQPADNQPVNAVPREDSDAKLQAIEARMDGRVASIEGKIDGMLARMEGRDHLLTQRMIHLEQSMGLLERYVRGLKVAIITTGIGSVLAIVVSVAAFDATVLSNMVASFESGKSTATSRVQTSEPLRHTQAQLRATQERLSAPPAPSAK